MTEQQLAAIEARANAATPGPWVVGGGGHQAGRVVETVDPHGGLGRRLLLVSGDGTTPAVDQAIARFIAAARQDVSALLAEVRTLNGLLADLCSDSRAAAEVVRLRAALAATHHLGGGRNAITVWAFGDAPAELRALSGHGGDEDWLALVPPGCADDHVGWMQGGTPFGCCDVSEHPLPDGWVVRIGAHA